MKLNFYTTKSKALQHLTIPISKLMLVINPLLNGFLIFRCVIYLTLGLIDGIMLIVLQ